MPAISCTAADLAAASKCLCGIASPADRQRVMIYLLQHIAGLDNLTPAELVARAKCLCGIPENRLKAIEVALLCAATGGVPPCPPSGGGAGCTYQDMQVAWTPTNLKLGELMGLFISGDTPGIQTLSGVWPSVVLGIDLEFNTAPTGLSFPNLVSVDPTDSQNGYVLIRNYSNATSIAFPLLQYISNFLTIKNNPVLTSLSFPVLTHLGADITITGNTLLASLSFPSLAAFPFNIDASANPALTTINLSSLIPTNAMSFNFSGGALLVASVDAILARFVAAAGYVNGIVDLTGGTNAAPSSTAPGSDYAILIGRGVTLTVNP